MPEVRVPPYPSAVPSPPDIASAGEAFSVLLRALLAAVEAAGPEGYHLTADSALFILARRCITDASAEGVASFRTAQMALRDLVFRVDMVRGLIGKRVSGETGAELHALLDTDDIHALLRELASAAPACQK